MTPLSAHMQAILKQADPYAEIAENLDRAIDLMRVVYLAMANPDRDELFDRNPCQRVLLLAEDIVDEARNSANQQAAMIWEASRNG